MGKNHPDLGYTLNWLGVVLLDEGDSSEAEPLLRESLTIWSRLDPSNVLIVTGLSNWARVLQAKGDYAEARSYFRQALSMAQQQTGRTYAVSRVLYHAALLEFDCGNYSAVEELASRALAMQRTIPGGESAPDTARTMTTVAQARLFQGDPAGAEPILRQALDILKKKLPLRYPPVMTAEIRLGETFTAEGKPAEAEPLLREALAWANAPLFRIPAWQAGEAESALGWCLAALGRSEEAIKFLRRSKQKLLNDPRPVFRRQADAHLRALLHAQRP